MTYLSGGYLEDQFYGGEGPPLPPDAGQSSLSANTESIFSTGMDPATLTVQIRDANGTALGAGYQVFLTTSRGALASSGGETNSAGQFSTTLTSPSSGFATVTAYLGADATGDVIGSVVIEVVYATGVAVINNGLNFRDTFDGPNGDPPSSDWIVDSGTWTLNGSGSVTVPNNATFRRLRYPGSPTAGERFVQVNTTGTAGQAGLMLRHTVTGGLGGYLFDFEDWVNTGHRIRRYVAGAATTLVSGSQGGQTSPRVIHFAVGAGYQQGKTTFGTSYSQSRSTTDTTLDSVSGDSSIVFSTTGGVNASHSFQAFVDMKSRWLTVAGLSAGRKAKLITAGGVVILSATEVGGVATFDAFDLGLTTATIPYDGYTRLRITESDDTLVRDVTGIDPFWFGASLLVLEVPLGITTESIPYGFVGDEYSAQLEAEGGTEPYTWSITAGALPDGLTLDADTGLISGTPTEGGEFTITVQVSDGFLVDTKSFYFEVGVEVADPVEIITESPLPTGRQGSAYSQQLEAIGGFFPYEWSVIAGTLPSGTTLSAGGLLSGTPTNFGVFNFTVRVYSGPDNTATKTFSLTVYGILAIVTPSIPGASTGEAYLAVLDATGGDGVETWSIESGALPDGLVLSTDGVISGVPTEEIATTVTVRVDSGDGQTAFRTYSLSTLVLLEIDDITLLNTLVRRVYEQTITATGGDGVYTWSVVGELIGFDFSTEGVLTGFPTQPGYVEFTARVDSGDGQFAQRTFGFYVLDVEVPFVEPGCWGPCLAPTPTVWGDLWRDGLPLLVPVVVGDDITGWHTEGIYVMSESDGDVLGVELGCGGYYGQHDEDDLYGWEATH